LEGAVPKAEQVIKVTPKGHPNLVVYFISLIREVYARGMFARLTNDPRKANFLLPQRFYVCTYISSEVCWPPLAVGEKKPEPQS
jgi:hypothetical protein